MDKKRQEQLKRVARIALVVFGALVAAICLVVGTTFAVLQTDWGGERLRRQVVKQSNKQIQGQLDIRRLSFGGNRLEVWDVVLNDPEGKPVAQVARVEVNFTILRLLRKEIRIPAFVIETPRLRLVTDDRGLNLTRAMEPREKAPKKEEPPTPPSDDEGWVIQLDRFDLKDGAVTMTSVTEDGTEEKIRLENLQSFLSARLATGNGALASTFRLTGRSGLAPVGPFRIETRANKTKQAVHFTLDSDLLGGTAKVRADIPYLPYPPVGPNVPSGSKGPEAPRADLERMDGEVKVTIPKMALHGFDWGPIQVDGVAHPGSIPKVELLVAIPGVELTGKSVSQAAFDLQGRLSLLDLTLTAKAAQALAGGGDDSPAAAGRGQLDFAVGGPMKGVPATWSSSWTGQFERLRFAENVISGLSLQGRVARLSAQPGEADFKLAIDSVQAGTTKMGKVSFAATLRQQDVSAELNIVSPQPLNLRTAGRLDDDRQGLSLAVFSLGYPGAKWDLEKTSRLRFGDQSVSLTPLRLISEGQALSVEGSQTGEQISAHLVVDKLRLDLLPEVVADPQLRLAGTLDVDVKATGEATNPKVVAQLALKQARFQAFSRLFAKVDATLADQVVDGSLSFEAPFTAAEARFKMPVDPLAPQAPLDLRLDVTRLDLGDALRTAAVKAPADGKVTLALQVNGTADDPKVDLTVNGRELVVTRPATADKGSDEIDVGHVKIHLTYGRRTARADIDFGSSHGGTLTVDATAKVDLSYPRVTRGIVTAKIPVAGKVVARDLDVAWISRFNERVETLGGQVNANAKLAGTVGDPQFLGDVRWKNGKVVATVPKKKKATAP